MQSTYDFLSGQPGISSKVVGIVGSRMPLSEYHSDGGFMLGYTIAQLQSNENGMYFFHPDNISATIKSQIDNIVFLMTGGTIDSSFREQADTAKPYEHSRIPSYFRDILGAAPAEEKFVFREICMRDSRELTETDIRALLQESFNQRHKKQIITAGTYALPDLANRHDLMLRRGELPQSKYLFVGAMLPDDVILNDGWFNLGYAMGKLPEIQNGVYVTMHGWATPPANVMKQIQEARFKLYDESLRG